MNKPQESLNQPKELRAWCFYDWANSVYSLVIATAIFPIYYETIVKQPVSFLGVRVNPTSAYTFAIVTAYFLVLLLNPILGGIADAKGYKKQFLRTACYLGALSCVGLYAFTEQTVGLGLFLFTLASFGFAMSDAFYNAYLPDIATPDKFDSLSAKGYSLGYIGGVILLIVSLVFIQKPELFGTTSGAATRFSFVLTGIWWMGFGTLVLARLRNTKGNFEDTQENIWRKGWKEVQLCLAQIKQKSVVWRYLIAFLCFNMGVQTIMYMSTMFGKEELKLGAGELIPMLLLIQFVGILGAFLCAWLAKKVGNIPVLLGCLLLWVGVCVYAYITTTKEEFYVLGTVVGLVMGGTQSTSRAFYAKIIPQATHTNASFFGFYSLVDKLSIVLGMGVFGILVEATGGMRTAIIFLITFFVLGLFMLFATHKTYKKS